MSVFVAEWIHSGFHEEAARNGLLQAKNGLLKLQITKVAPRKPFHLISSGATPSGSSGRSYGAGSEAMPTV